MNWRTWLRACVKDPNSPAKLPRGIMGAITGQDARALEAVAACWSLYGSSDEDGRRAALAAVRALLGGMQPAVHCLARELIAFSLDWSHREQLWPMVSGSSLVADMTIAVHEWELRSGRKWGS